MSRDRSTVGRREWASIIFYGFIGGETNQYYPVLFENTVAVEPDAERGGVFNGVIEEISIDVSPDAHHNA